MSQFCCQLIRSFDQVHPYRHGSMFLTGTKIMRIPITFLVLGVGLAEQECLAPEGEMACSPPDTEAHQCGLYLAPSTIPGAGLGVFTAHERNPGDPIHSHGEVCIPVIDLHLHSPDLQPFMDYYWSGDNLGLYGESNRTDHLYAFCLGLDAAANCHLALNNVFKAIPKYDDGSVTMNYHRNTHPGVGAFTPYYNGVGLVHRHIPPGGEIFKDYGDIWFQGRSTIFGNLPLTMDYQYAMRLLQNMIGLPSIYSILQRENAQDNLTPQEVQARWEMIEDLYETVLLNIRKTFDRRTLNALPDNFHDALVAYNAGDIAVILQPNHVHTLEYLEEHGTCLDNIRPGPSTLPSAGHGAFATRPLSAGTILTKSPLLHTSTDDYMYMYELVEYNGSRYRLLDEVRQMQLLYNYCYTHLESSIVLCPYGGGISYINHHPDKTNVRIEWATGWDIVHNQSLVDHGTMDDLTIHSRPQLAFSYIATRDIAANEELFMDYGDAWEEAWLEHVENYSYDKMPATTPKYASAHYWNHHMAEMSFRTIREQEIDPYPSNLQIRCHAKLLTVSVVPHAIYHWGDNCGLACRILDRFENFDLPLSSSRELYTVEMELANDKQTQPNEEGEVEVIWIQRTDVPRSAIRFYNLPYTTDLHLETAFRHSIAIPDELLPPQWRNL